MTTFHPAPGRRHRLVLLALTSALAAACTDAETAAPPTAFEGPAFGKGTYAKGRIAFHTFRNGEGDIYTMNADGTQLTNITNHPAGDYEPDWSANGKRILLLSYRTGDGEVYTMRR